MAKKKQKVFPVKIAVDDNHFLLLRINNLHK